jgi:acetyl-CoA C-acetyltransferase
MNRTPVIVGVGEVLDRPAAPELGLEPAALMVEALRRADQDANGAGWLARVDSLDVVNSISWSYRGISLERMTADLLPYLSPPLGVEG